MKKEKVPKIEEEVADHICLLCGTQWECGSRSCLENHDTVCGKCPCSLPECID
jgi:hypothetical protein